jgi:RimJ/RimL family protein N-acetyltransferase
MNFEITNDLEFIKKCLTDKYVWESSRDDGFSNVDPDLFFPSLIHGIVYLKAGEFGLLIGIPVNCITYDVHIALLPEARGMAKIICEEAIDWIFNATDKPIRLIASIPEFNKYAIKLATDTGMEFIGINKMSFLKNGKLFDQHMFGISKEIK